MMSQLTLETECLSWVTKFILRELKRDARETRRDAQETRRDTRETRRDTLETRRETGETRVTCQKRDVKPEKQDLKVRNKIFLAIRRVSFCSCRSRSKEIMYIKYTLV